MVLDRSIPDPLATMFKQQPCLGCHLQSRQYIWISVRFVLAGIYPAQFPHLNSRPACFICSTLYYICPVPFSFYARRLKIIIFNALSFYGDVPPRLRGRTASAIPARPPFRRRLHKRLTGFFVSTSMVASFGCCQTIQHFIVAFPSHLFGVPVRRWLFTILLDMPFYNFWPLFNCITKTSLLIPAADTNCRVNVYSGVNGLTSETILHMYSHTWSRAPKFIYL